VLSNPAARPLTWILKALKDSIIKVEAHDILITFAHATAVLQAVKVIVSAADAANKLFANLCAGHVESRRSTCDINLPAATLACAD
jgi:hypothetical protein